jgi:dTDP-4-amino-4,6-dideoxygalactose transaminase
MPAAPDRPPINDSVLEAWSAGWRHGAAFGAARSALAALLRQRNPRRVWTPAYACPALADAVIAAGADLAFYRVGPALEADLAPVLRKAAAGEAVIGIDYFGRHAGDAFVQARRQRPDLLWIEDRAQALDTGKAAWGEVVIYSPRKLVGVADGGLMYAASPLPAPSADATDHWGAEDARAADPEGRAPESWHGLFQTREAAMAVDGAAMGERGRRALASLALAPIAEARRANWRVLAERLEAFALWPDRAPRFAPLAFPIRVADAARAVATLAAERIWAPRHWADPAGPEADFPEAHDVARRLVSLPCDQRYGAADMNRVAEAVLRRLQPR